MYAYGFRNTKGWLGSCVFNDTSQEWQGQYWIHRVANFKNCQDCNLIKNGLKCQQLHANFACHPKDFP